MADILGADQMLPSRLVRTADVLRVLALRCRAETLIAGPFVGELGWELMEWQGFVRRLRRAYRKTVVISYPNSQCLYEDCEFWPHSMLLKDSGPGYGNWPRKRMLDLAAQCAADLKQTSFRVFLPVYLNKISRRVIGGQEFLSPRELRQASADFDIAFHFRNFQRAGDDYKNYPLDQAAAIVRYCLGKGWRVCCIGHPEMAACPAGAQDCRSAGLSETMQILRRVRIVAGGSSAPMHLASLCDLPIVVWTGPPFTVDRYFDSWNPHGSRVFLVSDKGFRPPVDAIIEQLHLAVDFASCTNATVVSPTSPVPLYQ